VTKLYTVKEIAAMLRCDTKTIYNMVAAGTIPHLRVGRLIRFDAELIEHWIKRP
jgi:excisionase family DNA binding protein